MRTARGHGVDDIVEGVMTGNAARTAAGGGGSQVAICPAPDLHEIFCPGQRAAQHDQQDLRQGKQHLPGLPWVLERGEMVEKRCCAHGSPRVVEAPNDSHKTTLGNPIPASGDCPAGDAGAVDQPVEPPNRSRTSPNTARHAPPSVTSSTCAVASPPASAAVSAGSDRSTQATLTPRAARYSAAARPMPPAGPTTATE